tara:strand:+ start:184 stop:1164 length:981 start_codon:yes stop_codon:yes gene_type:complete
MNLSGKTILVTGGLGHIGSYIIEEICRNFTGCKIICYDNNYNGNINNLYASKLLSVENNHTIVYNDGDIRNFDDLHNCFSVYGPHVVFHEASMLTLDSKSQKIKATEVGVMGSTYIFQLAKKYKVEKVVYASSASVYGNPQYVPTDEDCPKSCSLMYGAHKIAVESIAESYIKEEGVNIVGLRYFNVYGPRQSTSNVYTQIVAKWMNEITNDQKVQIYGDGSQTMDMIYGSDIGKLNIQALEAPSGFYNIGTGIQTSVKYLLDIMIKEIRPQSPNDVDIEYIDHDPALVKERCADVVKMHRWIGKHTISVEEGIKKVVEHYNAIRM